MRRYVDNFRNLEAGAACSRPGSDKQSVPSRLLRIKLPENAKILSRVKKVIVGFGEVGVSIFYLGRKITSDLFFDI